MDHFLVYLGYVRMHANLGLGVVSTLGWLYVHSSVSIICVLAQSCIFYLYFDSLKLFHFSLIILTFGCQSDT